MLKSLLVGGGTITNLGLVIGVNSYANAIYPIIADDVTNAPYLQIAAGVGGVALILARAIKTIAEAYAIKKQADNETEVNLLNRKIEILEADKVK